MVPAASHRPVPLGAWDGVDASVGVTCVGEGCAGGEAEVAGERPSVGNGVGVAAWHPATSTTAAPTAARVRHGDRASPECRHVFIPVFLSGSASGSPSSSEEVRPQPVDHPSGEP